MTGLKISGGCAVNLDSQNGEFKRVGKNIKNSCRFQPQMRLKCSYFFLSINLSALRAFGGSGRITPELRLLRRVCLSSPKSTCSVFVFAQDISTRRRTRSSPGFDRRPIPRIRRRCCHSSPNHRKPAPGSVQRQIRSRSCRPWRRHRGRMRRSAFQFLLPPQSADKTPSEAS